MPIELPHKPLHCGHVCHFRYRLIQMHLLLADLDTAIRIFQHIKCDTLFHLWKNPEGEAAQDVLTYYDTFPDNGMQDWGAFVNYHLPLIW